jgi:anthranilate phosphoribosyltransferase
MHKVIKSLLAGQPVQDADDWSDLWQKLNRGKLEKVQATALLSSLSTRLPERETLLALVGSLRHGHRASDERPWPGTVNVVGSGGGPRTFNISTAASVVAASMGVPVIKSGSRSYTSSLGSFDLLDLLGVQRSSSLAQTETDLRRNNISFTDVFVYPVEFSALTREIGYLEQRSYGRFFNALGPFLAQLPVAGQLTGVSGAMGWDSMSDLASESGDRTIWLCRNEWGVDELLGFADNTVREFHSGQQSDEFTLRSGELTSGRGELSDLDPPHRRNQSSHFLSLMAGEGEPAALETVLVNASALAVLSGRYKEWPEAMESARRSVDEGQASSLVTQLSEQGQGRLQRPRSGQ